MSVFLYKYEDDQLINRYEANKCCILNAEQFKTKNKNPLAEAIWSWQLSRLNTFNCFCDLGGLACHGFQGFGRIDLYEVITVCCTKELGVTKAGSMFCCGTLVMRMDQMCNGFPFGWYSLQYSIYRGIPMANNIPRGMFYKLWQWIISLV